VSAPVLRNRELPIRYYYVLAVRLATTGKCTLLYPQKRSHQFCLDRTLCHRSWGVMQKDNLSQIFQVTNVVAGYIIFSIFRIK